ncbi:MAG: hypothetical protein Kow0025_08720 [Thermodesulfovibrionales bacterium]
MESAADFSDITRSVIISAPAGSGKTEKLARRYISLLEGGSEVERILCITFTEKAAAEMKNRILSIVRAENPALAETLRRKAPLMRISTFHAFCLKLLRRFSVELGIDPSMDVADELTSRSLWLEAVYEGLQAEKDNPAGFFGMIRDRGIRGWNSLKRLLDELHARSPYPERMLREGPLPGGEDGRLLALYGECLERYRRKKAERRLLDFNDLELLAHDALSRGPEWLNILYSFDEHTDHILVDEFQDTNSLQWKIIDRLTEEWRSGMGAKREAGKSPTIFLVGDEKQSIYLFRGANVSVFHEAKENFASWLGRDYLFIEARENYRSLPAITGFANALFERLMPRDLTEPWKARYAPFEAVRQGDGLVELVLMEGGEGGTREARAREAEALAGLIAAAAGRREICDRQSGLRRPCRYGDMAVLLRRRTHLGLFEDALRREGIPFVVLKGIGFYDEPETAVLREMVCFLVDPSDRYSLFCLLRSPLFEVGYAALQRLLQGERPLFEKLRDSGSERLARAAETLASWLERAEAAPLARVLEDALCETGAWSRFRERQRHANIKKFVAMVEDLEARGLSPLEIREKLLRQRHASEVAKANINAEGMDAVRIMTIHAAKGLEFPMVFLPSMDESITPRSGPIAIDDEGGRVTLRYREETSERAADEVFQRRKLKESEEEKRLFYVAVTRAMDHLVMLGTAAGGKASGRLAYLEDAFGVLSGDSARGVDGLPFRVLREDDLPRRAGAPVLEPPGDAPFMDAPAYVEPLSHEPALTWRNVTDEVRTRERERHGEGWVAAGSVMHRIFEELSKGIIRLEDLEGRAALLLKGLGHPPEGLLETMVRDIRRMDGLGLLEEIVLPRENAFAELPFVLENGRSVISGRMDRLVLKDGLALVYDYKTFPVRKGELGGLAEDYRSQMEFYREAAERLFGAKARAFLLFTHIPELLEL